MSLERLKLRHFKCFSLQDFPLNRLTILAGQNASGKSSVLQSLVLLSQTMRDEEWSRRLLLNGKDLRLGCMTDVVDKVAGRRSFGIQLETETAQVGWSFESEDRRSLAADVERIWLNDVGQEPTGRLQRLLPDSALEAHRHLAARLAALSYLTAERMGPRELYSMEEPTLGGYVGCRGELAVSHLYALRDEPVASDLVVADHPPTLFRQVEQRMNQFFPGCALELTPIPQSNSVALGIRTSPATDFHRPTHVGFGLTQVLPIFVSCLSANADDLILLENPEVHLHPAGQAKMGYFLAEAANAGLQVILETHSDHILSGVRRAVKSGILSADKVTIHFVTGVPDGPPNVVSPTLDANGNIDSWPDGFFDQFDKDASYFAGWGS